MAFLRRRRTKPTAPGASDEPDEALVARARDDVDAFEPLYLRYHALVLRYCLDELRDPVLAEDATSQTFLRVMTALRGYRETGRFRAWLLTIAHNVIVNTGSRQTRGLPIEAGWDVPDPSATPEELAVASLDLAAIDAVIATLPVEDRRVIELRRAGLKGAEIATVLGITHEAAKKRQLRAMDRLEAALLSTQHRIGGRHGR